MHAIRYPYTSCISHPVGGATAEDHPKLKDAQRTVSWQSLDHKHRCYDATLQICWTLVEAFEQTQFATLQHHYLVDSTPPSFHPVRGEEETVTSSTLLILVLLLPPLSFDWPRSSVGRSASCKILS